MLECPKCGSRYLRPSRRRNSSEGGGMFTSPMRCLDCNHRFVTKTVSWSELKFARCPVCFRMDLSTWSVNSFNPRFWGKVRLIFGGHRWRCEYCRVNFVSLRRRKEIFTFKRWKKYGPGAEGEQVAQEAPPQEAP